MITKDNEPIYRQKDGNYTIHVNGSSYGVCDNNPTERYTIDMVEDYLAAHPEALVPEPVPPPPTPEQLAEQARLENLAYLASTDWYAIRFADTGEPIPADIKAKRQAARDAL